MFCCVLYYLVAFGSFGCLTKLSAKRDELVQKFVPGSRVLSFLIKHTRLSPLGSKLIFWCVSYYLGTFGTVLLPYKTRCKTGRSGAKVRAMKLCQNFSQRTYPSTPLNPKIMFHSVLYYFCAFGTIRLRYKTQCETGQTDAKVRATKSRFGVYCTIWMHSEPFGCLTKLDANRAEVVQKFVP